MWWVCISIETYIRERCSWNVSSGSNMAGLLLAVTGKKVIETSYGVVSPYWANSYHREISNPSGRWVFDELLQPVDRLHPGLWQIDCTHRHVSNQPRGKREKHGTWDATYRYISPTLSPSPYSRSPRIRETPSSKVIGCYGLSLGLPKLATLEVNKGPYRQMTIPIRVARRHEETRKGDTFELFMQQAVRQRQS